MKIFFRLYHNIFLPYETIKKPTQYNTETVL